MTALTETDTPGSTAPTCAFTSPVSCSRSARWKGRISTDDTGRPPCDDRRELEAATGAVRGERTTARLWSPQRRGGGGDGGDGADRGDEGGGDGREAEAVLE